MTTRRPKAFVSSISTNIIHLRSPSVTLWWSAAFPGCGQIILGSYLKGFLLILWEFTTNTQAHLNVAIIYAFTGNFELSKEVLNIRWLLLYIPVYVYGLWDAYRTTINLNKYALLADIQKPILEPFKISTLEINYLDKRNPWGAALWSAFMPGLGHLNSHSLPTGFLLLSWYMISMYQSHFLTAVHHSFVGEFALATVVVDWEWLLFLPSLYTFALYSAYMDTVEYNKLFETEQAMFLKREYQHRDFRMPI